MSCNVIAYGTGAFVAAEVLLLIELIMLLLLPETLVADLCASSQKKIERLGEFRIMPLSGMRLAS